MSLETLPKTSTSRTTSETERSVLLWLTIKLCPFLTAELLCFLAQLLRELPDVALLLRQPHGGLKPSVGLSPAHLSALPEGVELGVGGHLLLPKVCVGQTTQGRRGTLVTAHVGPARGTLPEPEVREVRPVRVDGKTIHKGRVVLAVGAKNDRIGHASKTPGGVT